MSVISGSVPVIINPTLSVLENCKSMKEVKQIHAQLVKTNTVTHTITITKLVAFCSLSSIPGALDYAHLLFRRVENPNRYMFTKLIKGFSNTSCSIESVILYANMLSCLHELNGLDFCIPDVIKACGKSQAYEEGMQVFGQVLRIGFLSDPFVSNSALRMLLELGEIEFARQVFDRMTVRDVISWNSMISGLLKWGEIDLAREVFDGMPERDLVSCNSMIDGYGKCGRCDLAEEVFEMVREKDVVTWTSMISGYVLNNSPLKALALFRKMMEFGVKPDVPALVSILSAIADLGFVEEGKWVHAYISTNRIKLTSGFLGSALIDMYCKCGSIENAYRVFRSISSRKVIGDWNSMISGFAMHGLGQETIEQFLEMERMSIEPDDITFLGVLEACSHAGLVKDGEFYFKHMKDKYRITPKLQHYGCLIDLYSRVGRFEDALEVIQNMPMEADVLAWKSILSASFKHGKVDIGEKAANCALRLSPKDSSCYVLLSNLYAKANRWDDVEKVRLMMKERGMRKIPGCSSILVDGEVHQFLVAKAMDVRYEDEILSKIDEMIYSANLEGYEADLTQVLVDVE